MNKSDLRPKLNLQPASSEIEQFQNEVIRPILKLQNDVLVLIFNNYTKTQQITLSDNLDKLRVQVRDICSKDISLKNQLIGMTIGMLETDELANYQIHQSEYNKRISQMIAQRLYDNLSKLT